MKNYPFLKTSSFILIAIILLLGGCGTPAYEPAEKHKPGELSETPAVPPDNILETVTWNIERYGSADNAQQTKNVIRVMDSLDADLYALQEIHSSDALGELLKPLTGYEGFTAGHVYKGQKIAFVYNTNTIDSLEAGAVLDVREPYRQDWKYYWANGRTPMYFRFDYTSVEGQTTEFFAIVIHGKANTGRSAEEYEEAYERRREAAEGLYYYLLEEQPDANIILLGDYNDDVDESLYYYSQNNFAPTPYTEFMKDRQNFKIITRILSSNKESSSVNFLKEGNLVDHITMSDELFRLYIDESAEIYDAPLEYIPNYESTTSDHLPVWAKFNITR